MALDIKKIDPGIAKLLRHASPGLQKLLALILSKKAKVSLETAEKAIEIHVRPQPVLPE